MDSNLLLVYALAVERTLDRALRLLAGGLLGLPEPEEELRPGTAMVSSRPEGEVDPIATQCRHRSRKKGGENEGDGGGKQRQTQIGKE
jgi:hypothetical protein